jgi:glycosyltransferase involved in cell wall biosynthesis
VAEHAPHPRVSVVVEWETGAECGGDRALRGLEAILDQAAAHARPTEVLLVCGPGVDPEPARSLAAARPDVPCRIVAAPEPLGYYEKKNLGFARSAGDVVVFVDSDLLAEPGWLEALLRPFDDPAKSVVVGRTHFEDRSFYERAMALFWIFDARVEADQLRRTERLVSNNIAFRRPLFAAFPFPSRSTYRNQCGELGGTLARLGIPLFEATAARAGHPAPAGVRAFVTRAARAGQDARAYAGVRGAGRVAGAWREWRRDLSRVRCRIAERAPLLRFRRTDRAAAAGLGLAYYSIKAAAYAFAPRRPAALSGQRSSAPA